jgi:predicted small metal-binding protein
MAKDKSNDKMSEGEGDELKEYSCDDSCGFRIRSRNEEEVIRVAGEHVQEFHDQELSDEDIKSQLQTPELSVKQK